MNQASSLRYQYFIACHQITVHTIDLHILSGSSMFQVILTLCTLQLIHTVETFKLLLGIHSYIFFKDKNFSTQHFTAYSSAVHKSSTYSSRISAYEALFAEVQCMRMVLESVNKYFLYYVWCKTGIFKNLLVAMLRLLPVFLAPIKFDKLWATVFGRQNICFQYHSIPCDYMYRISLSDKCIHVLAMSFSD